MTDTPEARAREVLHHIEAARKWHDTCQAMNGILEESASVIRAMLAFASTNAGEVLGAELRHAAQQVFNQTPTKCSLGIIATDTAQERCEHCTDQTMPCFRFRRLGAALRSVTNTDTTAAFAAKPLSAGEGEAVPLLTDICDQCEGRGYRDALAAEYTPFHSVAECESEAIAAVRLLEEAEDINANCEECDGNGVPEECWKCFPHFDAARVKRRLVMQSLAAISLNSEELQ